MSLTQQTGTEASHKVAALRGLLENPSIKPRIAPLVTLLMARDVDIHGKMLADLGSRVEQMKGSLDEESEHASRVSQRLHDIQQDANALRQIIQQDGRGDPDIGVDPEKLKFALTEAIKQNSTEVTRIGQRIMAVEKLIERQQQSSNGIKGILDTVGQGMESLQRDLNDLKHGFKEIPSTAPILKDMSILEGRVERCLDQSSKDAEDIKLSLAAITTQPGYDENLARGCLSDSPVLQPAKSANGNRTIDLIKTGSQGKLTPKQPKLENWPAIVEFAKNYERFKHMYKSNPPTSEPKFIETFLEAMNPHVGCVLQRHLLEIYPNHVTLITLKADEPSPNIFIWVGGIKWRHIRSAIPKFKDLRALQWALNKGLSGPGKSLTSK